MVNKVNLCRWKYNRWWIATNRLHGEMSLIQQATVLWLVLIAHFLPQWGCTGQLGKKSERNQSKEMSWASSRDSCGGWMCCCCGGGGCCCCCCMGGGCCCCCGMGGICWPGGGPPIWVLGYWPGMPPGPMYCWGGGCWPICWLEYMTGWLCWGNALAMPGGTHTMQNYRLF